MITMLLLVAHAIDLLVTGTSTQAVESLRLVVNEPPISKAAGVRPKLAKNQGMSKARLGPSIFILHK